MAAAGKLTYDLALNSAAFTRGLNSALSGAGGVFKKIALLGMGGGAAFIGSRMFNQAVDMGAALSRLSGETGEAAGNLLILKQAFEDIGSSGGQVPGMISTMRKNLSGLTETGKRLGTIFSALGLDRDALRGLGAMEQIQAIGEAINALPSIEDRLFAAGAIFGQGAARDVVQLFSSGAIERAAKGLGSLPAYMSNGVAESAEKLRIAQAHLGMQFRGMFLGIGEGLLPVFEQINQKILDMDLPRLGVIFGTAIEVAMEEISGGRWKELADEAAGYIGDALSAAFSKAVDKLKAEFTLEKWHPMLNDFFKQADSQNPLTARTGKDVWNPQKPPPSSGAASAPPPPPENEKTVLEEIIERADQKLAAMKFNAAELWQKTWHVPEIDMLGGRSLFNRAFEDGRTDEELLALLSPEGRRGSAWGVPGGFSMSSDQWARIGAFAGGSGERVTGLVQQANRSLGRIDKTLEAIQSRVANLQPVTI